MKRKPIFPMSTSELEALPTRQFLTRLKRLHQCERSLALSDRDFANDSGIIEFKESPEWVLAFEDLKRVLSGRDHIPRRRA